MKEIISVMSAAVVIASSAGQVSSKLEQIQQSLQSEVPRVLCVDERVVTGGQPTDGAFDKLAAYGYRSVLNLRTAGEGVDLERERQLVEKARMKYLSIPVISTAPKSEQADEFIAAVKEKSHHPMLIHCGSANRVGAFWMIYRVVEEGWAEDKALEEAIKIGLRSPELKSFAKGYIATHKAKKTAS